MDYFRSVIGIIVILFISVLFSRNRRAIDWKLVVGGVLLTLIFGILTTKVPTIATVFNKISEGFVTFLDFSQEGAQFLFGDLALNGNGKSGVRHSMGVIFAFQVLPTIIFFSTVSAGLYYLGILQKVVYGIAWVMSKSMRLSGAESLSTAGNIFLGQTEAPLLVKPFVPRMTDSELMCLMVGGMATIAGGVFAAYVAFLGGDSDIERTRFAAYLLSSSFMNAPASVVLAKIVIPEEEPEKIEQSLNIPQETLGVNLLDALATGASEGVKLALNVGGMLLAFIAVIALVNYILSDVIGAWTGLNDVIKQSTGNQFSGLSLQYLLGQIFRVFAFIMGVEWKETLQVGSLLGQKTVINEFVAYLDLAKMKQEGYLSHKSIVIATYALCGFSNFSSIAIQIGGIGAMAPNQQANISKLGIRALIAATLACMLTATMAGALVD